MASPPELKERRRRADEDQEEMDEEVDADVPVDADATLLQQKRKQPPRSVFEKIVKYFVDRLWSILFFASASVGCYELDLVPEVLYSKQVNRWAMNVCVMSVTVGIACGSYIELYRSMWKKEKVSYKTVQSSTRGLVAAMFATGISFVVAMWPVWSWLTLPYAFMAFFGVFMQMLVILPPSVQRVLIGVMYTAFMFTYLTKMTLA